jgi:ABC-type protease/lipase transport system fused ATPase/permease subunit
VLDEPNSNLDQEGEVALDNAVRALKRRGSIVIVISHRPKVVRNLDRLLVLVKGKMLAFGTHRQVSAQLADLTAQGPFPEPAAQAAAAKA